MSAAALEQTLPYECFAEQELDIFFGPLPSGQRLQEHHNLLKVHLSELIGPLDEEGSADVEME